MSSTGPGRPRKNPAVRHGDGTAAEIADAAAELFSKYGFTATSMNQIAKAVGVGQNSIYHHFGSKLGLLRALLLEGVTPGLRIAEALSRDADSSDVGVASRLYALAMADSAVLANWRWNIGALLLLPEARSPELAEFQHRRHQIRRYYLDFSHAVTARTGCEDVDDQVLRLVVSIINQRWDDRVTAATPRQLARSGLRICGWTTPMDAVDARARELLTTLRESGIDIPELP